MAYEERNLTKVWASQVSRYVMDNHEHLVSPYCCLRQANFVLKHCYRQSL